MRSLSASMLFPHRLQRRRPTDRRGKLPIDLRTGFWIFSGREIVEKLLEILRRQILVIVVVDLRHRRVDAGAEALDLPPREHPVSRDMFLIADPPLAEIGR